MRSLPDVLTVEEIARIILRTRERRYQTFWLTTYSLNLRVGDLDSARGQVHVRAGKGRKDRFVVLPALTLVCLRRHWRDHRHPQLLFPGRSVGEAAAAGVMDRGSTQKAFARVVADCGIRKKVSIHSLRHAYATHLIEVGLNLRGVQELLGRATLPGGCPTDCKRRDDVDQAVGQADQPVRNQCTGVREQASRRKGRGEQQIESEYGPEDPASAGGSHFDVLVTQLKPPVEVQ